MLRALPAVVLLASGLVACSDDVTPSAAPATASPSPSRSPSPSPSPAPPSPTPTTAQLPPPVAETPQALAAQLVQAERTIRSGRDDVAVEAHVQQAAYRALVARPEWREEVLAAVPADLRPVVEAHVRGLAQLQRLVRPQPALPKWRIVAPPPAEELLAYYREAEAAYGVGWEYLAAIHLVESRMGRIRGTSSAGAQGPMQFMPQTWAAYGQGDVQNPRDAILAAARYLVDHGAPGNMRKAVYAYNHSDAYVDAILMHAEQMQSDPDVYRGYYDWQVYYRTTDGDRVLPVGYDGTA